MTDTRTRVLAAFTAHFGAVETPEADPLDAVILRDLRPDSLDVIELAMELEDRFQITISDDEIMAMAERSTIRDVLGLVEWKLAGKVVA